MKQNYKLKRTAKSKFVLLKPNQYKVLESLSRRLKVKVFNIDEIDNFHTHVMTFQLSKNGRHFINAGGAAGRRIRKNKEGVYITIAIPIFVQWEWEGDN